MKKIRVLQVIPALTLGGISSVVMNWYRHIDTSKYEFDFISFNDGPLREEITARGGNIYIIPTLKQLPLVYLKAVNKLLSNKPIYDVVHVHNSFKNGLLLWIAKLKGVKVRVCHSHTSGVENKVLLPVIKLLKFIVTSASNVDLACGKEAGKFLYGNKSFTVINNAISVQQYLRNTIDNQQLKAKFALPHEKIIVLHVGRFSVVKNHYFLLQLAKEKSLCPSIHFVCVGEGPLKESFQQEIKNEKLVDRFTILPVTPEIPALLTCSDAFIMPSLFEGVSVALLEAQAATLPCFISDTIARESDMGLDLVTFHSLNNYSTWVQELNNIVRPHIASEEVSKAFFSKGFSTESALVQLTEFYQTCESKCSQIK